MLQALVDRGSLHLGLPSVTAVAARQQRLHGDPWRLQDVILMDIEALLQGIEAAEDIRRREAVAGLAPVPIVALTAYGQASERQCCQAVGISDYLIKPPRKQALSAMLLRWL